MISSDCQRRICRHFLETLFAISLYVIACQTGEGDSANKVNDGKVQFEVKLHDFDFSTASGLIYTFTNKKISVVRSSGLVGDTSLVAFAGDLENDRLYDFLLEFSKLDLSQKYIDESMDDGDQKLVGVDFGNSRTQIQISNYYQRDVAKLIDVLNSYLPKELWIEYTDPDTLK